MFSDRFLNPIELVQNNTQFFMNGWLIWSKRQSLPKRLNGLVQTSGGAISGCQIFQKEWLGVVQRDGARHQLDRRKVMSALKGDQPQMLQGIGMIRCRRQHLAIERFSAIEPACAVMF